MRTPTPRKRPFRKVITIIFAEGYPEHPEVRFPKSLTAEEALKATAGARLVIAKRLNEGAK